MNNKNFYKMTVILSFCIAVQSCVPAVLGVSGVMGGGKMSLQEKTIGESLSDSTIWTKIRTAFIKNEIDSLFGSINIEVSEGKVLLTGSVENKENIITILRLVWQQDGVKEVINELKIVSKEERPGVFDYTKDSWITTKIKTKLLLSPNIRSINYSVETIDGVVYLFGVSRNQIEIEDAKDVISSVHGVKEIKTFVRIKKDLDARIEDTDGSSYNKTKEDVDLEDEIDQELPQKKEKINVQDKLTEKDIFDEE